MPAKSITDAFARNVRPPRKSDKPNQTAYIDTLERGLGLVLVVSYGGSKTFRVLTYDASGRPKTRKLGRYPAMKVKEARAKAREYYENPEKVEAAATAGTFKSVADEWLRRHVEANKLRSEREIKRHLDQYVFPKWGDRPFVEIRRGEVNDLLDHIADNHGPSQADAVLATIRGVMNWYEGRSEFYSSPIVKRMRRQKPKSRDRILSDDEMRAVWSAAEGTFGGIVKIALLTAQRRQQIAGMRWDDVKDGVWAIPTEARAKGTGELLKLPATALSVIEAQPRISGSPFVFAGAPRGRRRSTAKAAEPPAFNSWSQRKAELDAKLPGDMPHWTVHDLRRTARSLMARADVRPDIAERVLGHAIAGVEGVYDRHKYFDQKADALTRLAALVETIINPPAGNVVPMRKR